MPAPLCPVDDPGSLIELFSQDPAVHPYGLCDLEEPYWSSSTWWRRGGAAVGVLHLAEADAPIVYAVTAHDADDTLALLADLDAELPPRFVATGPVGLGSGYGRRKALWHGPHVKMWLAHPEDLPDADPHAALLSREHLGDILELFDTDPAAGDFFVPHLLDSGHYVGRWADHRLIAMAGVHVVSPHFGVAAIGNVATHPAHRGRGLGRSVVATVCRGLLPSSPMIGLNVSTTNAPARALYRRLGFADVVAYEEAELVRTSDM